MKIASAKIPVVGILCLVFVIFGCASIVSKSQYPISINSQPDQATIKVTDESGKTIYSGKTPTTVTLDTKKGYFSGKDYTVTFEKEGYTKHTAQIRRGVDGWYILGNLFFGGIIGWLIVDPLTGAMWTLDKECNATLTPLSSSKNSEHSLRIVQIDDVPHHLYSKLKKIN